MLDTFKSFLALYVVDVVGVSESRAALMIAVWVGVGLLGDLLLIPLLERVRGLTYLRFSVVPSCCCTRRFCSRPRSS
mgnify:CR=1 FL=1